MKEKLTFKGTRYSRRVLRIYTAPVSLGKGNMDMQNFFSEFQFTQDINPELTQSVFLLVAQRIRRMLKKHDTSVPIAFQLFDAVDTILEERDAQGDEVVMEYERKPLTPKWFFDPRKLQEKKSRTPDSQIPEFEVILPHEAQKLYEWLKSMDDIDSSKRNVDDFNRRKVRMDAYFTMKDLFEPGEKVLFTTSVLKIGLCNFVLLGEQVKFHSF